MDRRHVNGSDFDVLIVGAGMVGLSLAVALGRTALKVGVIEAKSLSDQAAQDDGRASAIALGSAQILDQLGVWRSLQSLGVSPVHEIQISDEGYDHVTTLRREDMEVEALGYIVENRATTAALVDRLSQCSNIHWMRPAMLASLAYQAGAIAATVHQGGQTHQYTAKVVIGADGRQSQVRRWAHLPLREWAYDQVLVVCTITTEQPHQQIGYERFHASGPFAILPMAPLLSKPDQHRCCVVWTVPRRQQQVIMGLSDAEFIAALYPYLSPNLGQVLSVSPRAYYVPRRQHAQQYVAPRIALIGDAAHATHPVGGQGFNMGLRDVAMLLPLLSQAHLQGKDLGDERLLRHYQQQRHRDNETVLFGTDLANRLFSTSALPLRSLRHLALLSIERIPALRHQFLRYAMGVSSGQSPATALWP
jgi:ubiquinone biosynthesis UbiH/UbiF/VisC/COQ6 family hydroxylase